MLRIDARSLGVGGFGIASELTSGELEVAFGRSRGVQGVVETGDGRTVIRMKTDTTLAVERVAFPMSETPWLVTGPCRLKHVDVDLTLGGDHPVTGQAKASHLVCRQLRMMRDGSSFLDADDVVAFDVRMEGEGKTTAVSIGHLRIGQISIPMGDRHVQLLGLKLRGLRVEAEDGGWRVKAEQASAASAHVTLPGLTVALQQLGVVECGASPDAIRAREVEVGKARARMSELDVGNGASRSDGSNGRGRRWLKELFSLLSGKLHVDVVTQVRIPYVRWRRRAHHPLRLELRDGMIDYRALERCLARLEDAVLDFELESNELRLVKDIPFVPFDRRTLVTWTLPNSERDMARTGWVQVARLTEPEVEIEPKPEGHDEGPRFIEEIRAANIDIALDVARHPAWRVPGGGWLRFGDPLRGEPTVEELRITGEVVYRPDQVDDAGMVAAEAQTICLGFDRVPVGERKASADRVDLSRARATLKLADLKPTGFELDVEGSQLSQLVLA